MLDGMERIIGGVCQWCGCTVGREQETASAAGSCDAVSVGPVPFSCTREGGHGGPHVGCADSLPWGHPVAWWDAETLTVRLIPAHEREADE